MSLAKEQVIDCLELIYQTYIPSSGTKEEIIINKLTDYFKAQSPKTIRLKESTADAAQKMVSIVIQTLKNIGWIQSETYPNGTVFIKLPKESVDKIRYLMAENHKKTRKGPVKPAPWENIYHVSQYDIDGNYIQTFHSIQDAADAVHTNYHVIYNACRYFHRYHTASGYQWRIGTDTSNIEPCFQAKRINAYTVDGKCLVSFTSIQEVMECTGFAGHSIRQVCMEKKLLGGLQWRSLPKNKGYDTSDIEPYRNGELLPRRLKTLKKLEKETYAKILKWQNCYELDMTDSFEFNSKDIIFGDNGFFSQIFLITICTGGFWQMRFCKYDLKGRFICSYASIEEAAEDIDAVYRNLFYAFMRKASFKKFQWEFASNNKNIPPYISNVTKREQNSKIHQYQINGSFCRSYNSASEAASFMGMGFQKDSVYEASRFKKEYKGYLWRDGEFKENFFE